MTNNAFLAVPLADETRHELAAALTEASDRTPMPGRKVPPENWHLTVRFLGDVEDLLVDRVLAELDETLDVQRGTGRVTALGAFPKPARAGIVFASVDDTHGSLAELAGQCEEACRIVGLDPEERRFVPHITLSRLRPQVDVRPLLARFGDMDVRIPVRELVMYRSERTSNGLRYVELASLPLN